MASDATPNAMPNVMPNAPDDRAPVGGDAQPLIQPDQEILLPTAAERITAEANATYSRTGTFENLASETRAGLLREPNLLPRGGIHDVALLAKPDAKPEERFIDFDKRFEEIALENGYVPAQPSEDPAREGPAFVED